MEIAWVLPLISVALSFIGAGVGAYFGGYLKMKGENLATHEDIQKLNDQVKVVTRTTEEIKTEIADAAWSRQKVWELRREVLFEATKRLAEAAEALVELDAQLDMQEMGEIEKNKINDKLNHAERGLYETLLLVEVVCEKETVEAFRKFAGLTHAMVDGGINKKDAAALAYRAARKELWPNLDAARAAARKELGIDA